MAAGRLNTCVCQVPWMIRKAAGLSKPTLILEQDGDTIKETSKSMKTTVLTLTAGGEPVEHKDGGVRRGCGARR